MIGTENTLHSVAISLNSINPDLLFYIILSRHFPFIPEPLPQHCFFVVSVFSLSLSLYSLLFTPEYRTNSHQSSLTLCLGTEEHAASLFLEGMKKESAWQKTCECNPLPTEGELCFRNEHRNEQQNTMEY